MVFLPLMFVLGLAFHLFESGATLSTVASVSGLHGDGDSEPVNIFWRGGWGTATKASQHVLEQVHCAIIGYMLKDFAVYPGGLETGYVLHHIFSVVGCTLCLWFPSAMGIITFQAVQCEFASALFSAQTLYPTGMGRALYFVSMTASNVGAAWLSWLVVAVFADMAPLPHRGLYGTLTVLLLIIRSVGLLLEGMSAFSGGSSGGEKKKEVKEKKSKGKEKGD